MLIVCLYLIKCIFIYQKHVREGLWGVRGKKNHTDEVLKMHVSNIIHC